MVPWKIVKKMNSGASQTSFHKFPMYHSGSETSMMLARNVYIWFIMYIDPFKDPTEEKDS